MSCVLKNKLILGHQSIVYYVMLCILQQLF